jgi:hypothetical protein
MFMEVAPSLVTALDRIASCQVSVTSLLGGIAHCEARPPFFDMSAEDSDNEAD